MTEKLMIMSSGSRLSHHLRLHHHRHHHLLGFSFGLGFHKFCPAKPKRPTPQSPSVSTCTKKFTTSSSPSIDFGPPLVGCVQPKSPFSDSPVLSDRLSQNEDDQENSSEGLSVVAGGIVALGKFDALHIGHRELAIQASKIGVPFLLSFVGMAEVLGWEPRAPIVAKCDRKRVLSAWAQYCGNVMPRELQLEFSKVRHLTPHQFVEKLAKELGVSGVVAGENYRFGYRAAGDASELVRLCQEYGMEAYIINSVMDKNQDAKNMEPSNPKEQGQVSSTRVRHALAKGDMKYVSELLGRRHRLMLTMEGLGRYSSSKSTLSAPRSSLLNLPPKEGLYKDCSAAIGHETIVPCSVIIDTTHIHLELDEVDSCIDNTLQDLGFLSIDFGESGVC